MPGDAAAGDSAHRPYAWQLLKLVAGNVASLGDAGDDQHACAAVLNSLPWLVEQDCAALAEHRQAAEVAEAITRRAGQPWQPPPGSEGVSVSGVSRSADFHFYSALVQPLLDRLADAAGPAVAEQLLRWVPRTDQQRLPFERLLRTCGISPCSLPPVRAEQLSLFMCAFFIHAGPRRA